jgi:acyl-CoA reductase-like NAD-dependent aldehyde dehydrogenase
MRVYAEESFGPLVSIVVAENSEDAVQNANDTEYGLSSAIFSRDVNKAMKTAERLETGMCHINGSTVHDEPQMPFGGMKHSGWGRFGGAPRPWKSSLNCAGSPSRGPRSHTPSDVCGM